MALFNPTNTTFSSTQKGDFASALDADKKRQKGKGLGDLLAAISADPEGAKKTFGDIKSAASFQGSMGDTGASGTVNVINPPNKPDETVDTPPDTPLGTTTDTTQPPPDTPPPSGQGVITGAINQADPFSDIKGYQEERVETPFEDTVEGRVQRIIEGGGKAQQLEVTRALQGQNQAGTLNSSMAIGAAELARIQGALPIAQQDAQAALQARLANQAASGQAGIFTAGELNVAGQQQRAGQQQLEAIGAQSEADILKQQDAQAFTTSENMRLHGYDQDTASRLAQVETNRDYRLEDIQTARDVLGHINDMETLSAEDKNLRVREALGFLYDSNLESMSNDNRVALQEMADASANQRQTSTSASNIWANHTMAVDNILSNPDISTENKQSLINQLNISTQAGLSLVKDISGIDFDDLLVIPAPATDTGAVDQATGDAIIEQFGEQLEL